MANLSIYNLGQLGVNVDKDPIQLEDGELSSAQNTIKDPLGVLGGVTKRLGMVQFNGSAALGTLLGGVGVPLVHPTAFTIYAGRSSSLGGLGASQGWWKTTSNFTTTTTPISVNPAKPRGNEIGTFAGGSASILGGSPGAGCVRNNVLYYAAGNYSPATDNLPIRSFDGTIDKELGRISPNSAAAYGASCGILSMISANGTIYLSTFDAGTTSTTWVGRVLQLDPSTGTLTQLGASFPAGFAPYALAWHSGQLWVGTHQQVVTASSGRVYRFRPGVSTAWALDTVLGQNIASLQSYNGFLYAGAMGASANFASVFQRDGVGAWTTSLTASGGTARDSNGFLASTVLGANMYFTYWNNDAGGVALIKKYDGVTWSTVFTGSSTTVVPYGVFYQFNGSLFVMSVGLGTTVALLSTPDGSSWTDNSVNLTSAYSGIGLAVLFGVSA